MVFSINIKNTVKIIVLTVKLQSEIDLGQTIGASAGQKKNKGPGE